MTQSAENAKGLLKQITNAKRLALEWEIRADKTPQEIIDGPLKEALHIASQIDNEIEFYILTGWSLFLKGQYQDAALTFDQGLELSEVPPKKEAELLGWKCRALIFLRKPLESLDLIERAIPLDPKNTLLHFRRGTALLQLSRYEESMREFRKVRQTESLAILAGSNLAYAQYFTGDLIASLETLERTAGIVRKLGFPPHPDVLNNKGVFYHELAQDIDDESKDEDAGWLYRKALEAKEKSAEPFYNYGLFCLRKFARTGKNQLKWLREAEGHFSEALKWFKYYNDPAGQLGAAFMKALASAKRKSLSSNEQPLNGDETISQLALQRLLEDIDHFVREHQETRTIEEQNYFRRESQYEKKAPKGFLLVLNKWDVGTAPLPSMLAGNTGGGYFIKYGDKGIVIDPGVSFLQNLLSKGIAINDVNYIIVTHPHITHSRDLEPLLLNLQDMQTKWHVPKKVDLLVTKEVLVKYSGCFQATTAIRNIELLRPKATFVLDDMSQCKDAPIRIETLEVDPQSIPKGEALHVGFILSLPAERKSIELAYVNDNPYSHAFVRQFEGHKIDILLLPMGRISFKELIAKQLTLLHDNHGFFLNELAKIPRDFVQTLGFKNLLEFRDIVLAQSYEEEELLSRSHLGFWGAIRLIETVKPRIAILTDFKREIGKLRHTLAATANSFFQERELNTLCLTGDIGLAVRFRDLALFCDYHQAFEKKEGFKEVPSRTAEESIAHFCNKCGKEEIASYLYSYWGRPVELPEIRKDV